MSTENRNKVLLGFGGLVVVLVVAIALWPPNFRKEDASGAVGAVQKHHAPQITQKDVILGGEKTKHQQKVLYADEHWDKLPGGCGVLQVTPEALTTRVPMLAVWSPFAVASPNTSFAGVNMVMP